MKIAKNGTAYSISGQKNAPAVTLIHGLGLNQQITWGEIKKQLEKKFKVITYDLPGHGKTKLPKSEVTLKKLSNQIITLLNEINIKKTALVGFSIGGMINRQCVIDNPDRISVLVVLNSPHQRTKKQQEDVEKRARESYKKGPDANIDQTINRWFTENFRNQNKKIISQVRKIVLGNNHRNYANHRKILAEGVKELINPKPPITKPTLIITTQNDTGSTPQMSRKIKNEIKNAEIIIIPKLKHLGLIEKPNLFTKPIQKFLTKNLNNQ